MAGSADGPAMRYTVTFSLMDRVSVGALQYEVRYPASGRFLGDRHEAACTSLLDHEVRVSFRNDPEHSTLRSAWFSALGFEGPTDLAECVFETHASGALESGQFLVSVKLVSALSQSEVEGFPRVTVSKVRLGGGRGDRIVRLAREVPAG